MAKTEAMALYSEVGTKEESKLKVLKEFHKTLIEWKSKKEATLVKYCTNSLGERKLSTANESTKFL